MRCQKCVRVYSSLNVINILSYRYTVCDECAKEFNAMTLDWLKTYEGPIEEKWMSSIAMNDGHYYRLTWDNKQVLWLQSWEDNGSLSEAQLNHLTDKDMSRLGGFCDVSTLAFDSFEHICTFAQEVGMLLNADTVTIIQCMRG